MRANRSPLPIPKSLPEERQILPKPVRVPLRSLAPGDYHHVFPGQLALGGPEGLPNKALEAIPQNGLADTAANGKAQPGLGLAIRPSEDHEEPTDPLLALLEDPLELTRCL